MKYNKLYFIIYYLSIYTLIKQKKNWIDSQATFFFKRMGQGGFYFYSGKKTNVQPFF